MNTRRKNPNKTDYFPDGVTQLTIGLRNWRQKFKKIGKNVMVYVAPKVNQATTIKQLVREHGDKTVAQLQLLKPNTWRKATAEEIFEYNQGALEYKARCLSLDLAKAERIHKERAQRLVQAKLNVKSAESSKVVAARNRKTALEAFNVFANLNPDHPVVVSTRKARAKSADLANSKLRMNGSESNDPSDD